MSLKKITVLILSLAISLFCNGQEKLFMSQLSVDDGLPHTDITAIIQDEYGFMWIGSSAGLTRYDGNEFKTFDISNSILESSRIRSLYIDKNNFLFIGTETGGVTIFDICKSEFTRTIDIPLNSANYMFGADDGKAIYICTNDGLSKLTYSNDNFNLYSWSLGCVCLTGCNTGNGSLLLGLSNGLASFEDGKGLDYIKENIFPTSILKSMDRNSFFITSYQGCYLYDSQTKKTTQLSSYPTKSSCYDDIGNIYVGTVGNRILCYDKTYNLTNSYIPVNNSFHDKASVEISTLTFDKSSVLWAGTVGNGCYRGSSISRAFQLYSMAPENSSNQIACISSDSKGRLWVSSKNGYLSIIHNGKQSAIHQASLSGLFCNRTISSVWESPKGDVWIGSWVMGIGIIPAEDVVRACAGKPFRMKRPAGLPDNLSIYRIRSDKFNSIWITTDKGVWRSSHNYLYNSSNKEWTHIHNIPDENNSLSDDFTTDLLIDDSGVKIMAWVGSRNGLNLIQCDENGKIATIKRIKVIPGSDIGEYISFIHKDSRGSLWVSALGLGLGQLISDTETCRFRIYNKSTYPSFPNNEFESLLEDNIGNFWIGGFGIIRFNPISGQIKCFTQKDGLQSNAFKIWDAAKLPDGRMAFGSVNGLNVFFPENISENSVKPKAKLTDIFINGVSYDDSGKLSKALQNDLKLPYKENNITLEFSAMHYVKPSENKYKYRLEGLDDTWHYTTGKNPQASYLKVRPGTYTFHVYAANSDGIWGNIPASIKFRISPPWYYSAFAITIYILITFGGIVVVTGIIRKRSHIKHQKELKDRILREQQRRNEAELKFHTDFLHEIKTPLTLITTPIEELMQNTSLGKNTINRLQLVDQSARILKKHIEDITDIRKYDNGYVKMHVVQVDFKRFVEEIYLLFEPVVKSKGITYNIDCIQLSQKVFIDKDKIEKVILNLLSNAIKYSPEQGGGVINVNITENANSSGIVLSVSNIGIGIPPEDLPYIFDRFRQGSNNDRGGMGIGLAICKHAISQHGGKIKAESIPGGVTTFYVELPYGDSHFKPEMIDRNYENSDNISNYDPLENFITHNKHVSSPIEREHHLLVVDDNPELREYLYALLSTKYNITLAEDGWAGYEKTISLQPDLILTDIVMPRMDGLELCRRIKENTETSHIPVILLSARDMPLAKIEGFNMLADDYIIKPFRADILLSRIDNLIKQRECMKKAYRTSIKIEPSAITATSADETFIKKCISDIEAHISEPDYGVEQLCQNIGYSRPTLYRKIKSITDLTAIQFLRSIRLKRAAQLLAADSGKSVSQIMYETGFSNITYFSKLFYSEFGVHPKEYKENKK